jgi:Cytochrome c7 and related cytochrome c
LIRVVWLAVAAIVAASAADPPVQPIPYSHKQHLALGLKCANCHLMPDPGEMMGFPPEEKCMACHQSVKTDSPAIRKLAAFAAKKQPVPWVRVYQIPGYVFFSHKFHLEAGATCEACHGKVAERERLFRETDLSMGACMSCHRANRAAVDCLFCHEQR